MAQYEFLSTWCLAGATRDDAFEALRDSVAYPRWWKGVQSAAVVRPGAERNIGEVVRFAWRSVLPYTLRFDLELTRIEAPSYIEARATGELEGTGAWRLYEGPGLAVVYEWRVRTTKPWMNMLGPLARPAFVWNHDLVMRQGAEGFAHRLGAKLVVCD